jgi:hypothetical protein
VTQGNWVFTDLTMRENLEMGGITLPTKQAVNEGMEGVCSNGSGGAMGEKAGFGLCKVVETTTF